MTTWTTLNTTTNLVHYSEEFENWLENGATATDNYVAGPFEGTFGSLVTDADTGQNGNILLNIKIVPTGTGEHTYSIFIKKDDDTSRVCAFGVGYNEQDSYAFVRVNTVTGEMYQRPGIGVEYIDMGCDDYGDYWRVWSSSVNNRILRFYFYPCIAATLEGAGDDTLTGSAVIYGAQLETGSSVTGYVPTDGVPVTAKRTTYWQEA